MKKFFLLSIITTGCAFGANATNTNPDVTGDGKVSIEDANAIYNYILSADSSISLEAADVDGNGQVNTLDVIEVYRAMTEDTSNSIDATNMTAVDIATIITSAITNGDTDIDITLPADISAEDFKTAISTPINAASTTINITLRGITTIPESTYAFRNCTKISFVSIPDATAIGKQAFLNASQLTGIYAPKAATIGASALKGCLPMTEITLPVATSAGSQAFHSIQYLTKIELPAVTSLGSEVLRSCPNLTAITFGSPLESVGTNMINSDLTSVTLTLSADQKQMTGNNTDGWTATDTNYWDSADYTSKSFCGFTFKEIIKAD